VPARLRLARAAHRVLPARFGHALALIALAGLAVRVAYTVANRHYPVMGDALVYHLDARHLADGAGFQRPFEPVPTAEHPPVFIVLLALVYRLGGTGVLAQKLAMCLLGTVTVVLIALLARRAAGPRAGLLAAALASVYPLLWAADGSLMSETPYGVTIVAVLLAAYGYQSRPTWPRAALVGALIGVAALTRAEALWLVPILGIPLAWRGPPGWRPRLASFAAIAGAFALVLAPWTIRNLRTFEKPILISSNGYGVLVGANNHRTFYTDQIGMWLYGYYRDRAPGDESQYSVDYRDRGLRYVRDHAGRLPVVVAARVGRVWDVYRTDQQGFMAAAEGRHPRAVNVGRRVYWAVALLALAGLAVLWRRRAPLLVLLAPVVLVTWSAAIVYGSTRFRFAAEPALVVLAAVALDAALRAHTRRTRAARPAPARERRVAAAA
jgi:4-amino-4-deoxy-L-arabinose transferase-like glycosyltransferase